MIKINKIILLVGLIGSGKTSVGKRLAKKLNLPFIDGDQEIEKAAGLSVIDVFKCFGMEEYRAGEERIMKRLLSGSIFDNFHNLMDFCSLLNKDYFIPSSLYKKADKYILLVEFPVEMDNSQIITFMITAEEYGAECSNQRLEGYYLSEHAKLIIKDKAVETLFRMN